MRVRTAPALVPAAAPGPAGRKIVYVPYPRAATAIAIQYLKVQQFNTTTFTIIKIKL